VPYGLKNMVLKCSSACIIACTHYSPAGVKIFCLFDSYTPHRKLLISTHPALFPSQTCICQCVWKPQKFIQCVRKWQLIQWFILKLLKNTVTVK